MNSIADVLYLFDTRQQAFVLIQPQKSRLQTLVLENLGIFGPSTTEEVELRLELSHQTVSPRILELSRKGLIVSDGQRKTRSGRNAQVWRLR